MKNNLKNISQTGFTTPKGYFNDLDADLLNISKIDAIKTKITGFKAPHNYFDTLEDKLSSKISEAGKANIIQLFSKKNLVYFSGIAAAILISFSIYISKPEITFDTIDIDVVENYLSETDITSEEMVTLFTEDLLIEDEFIQDNLTGEFIDIYILSDDNLDDLLIEQ